MEKPIIALVYDFDKTLCTRDMQEYGYIPKMQMQAEEFWREVNDLTDEQQMDHILAYMFKMVEKAKKKEIFIRKSDFLELGKEIEYFDGVVEWFAQINAFAKKEGVILEHYIVSSGIKEIIEGTSIAKYFKKIYACEFMYDYMGAMVWPKMAINYTTKTQFLFRINKGILEINTKSSDELNAFTPEEERRIPFKNIIYIGDGITDVPCMKLVREYGGNSIAVYNEGNGERDKEKVQKLLEYQRVNFATAANYAQNSELDQIVKAVIRKANAVFLLEQLQKPVYIS